MLRLGDLCQLVEIDGRQLAGCEQTSKRILHPRRLWFRPLKYFFWSVGCHATRTIAPLTTTLTQIRRGVAAVEGPDYLVPVALCLSAANMCVGSNSLIARNALNRKGFRGSRCGP
jgi:hypothetical protein